MPLRTTARMTAFSPGQSPPPVRSPIRAIARGSLRQTAQRAIGGLSEVDDGADAVLLLHQLEALVDLVERDVVRQQRRDVDLARQPPVDERRHLLAALQAAERGARDAPSRDQEARDDVERLALARPAGDGA